MAEGIVGTTAVAGLLTGKAMAYYAALSVEDSIDYDKVKRAVFH